VTTVPIVPGTATVALDGSGNGTAKLGPVGAREVWQPSVASVSVATNAAEASCKILVGDPVSQTFVDGTLSGSTGDSTDRVSAYSIPLGWFVWAKWAGGDPGAVATLSVGGTRTV
jgi:hypothetical protein